MPHDFRDDPSLASDRDRASQTPSSIDGFSLDEEPLEGLLIIPPLSASSVDGLSLDEEPLRSPNAPPRMLERSEIATGVRSLLDAASGCCVAWRRACGRRSVVAQVVLLLYSLAVYLVHAYYSGGLRQAERYHNENLLELAGLKRLAFLVWLAGFLVFGMAAVVTLKEPAAQRDDQAERPND